MAAEDIVLRLIAQGVSQTASGIGSVTKEVDHLGKSAGGAVENVRALDGALDETGDSARAAGDGLDDAARSTEKLGDEASETQDKNAGLIAGLEKTRNVGLVMTGIGAAGLAITGAMISAANEGNGLEVKLESILETQGRLADLGSINAAIDDVRTKGNFDDDDGLRDAAIHLASFGVASKDIGDLLPRVGRQVRSGFGDLTSVADGLGKAYAAMDLAPLKRSGLVFTDLEEASVKAAAGISEAAGKAKFMEVVMAGIDRNTVTLEGSLTASEAAANNFANAVDGAMTNVGTGAGDAKAGVDSVLTSILGVVNEAPGLEYAAGYLGYFVSGGATVVGSLLTVGSQLAITALSFQGMGITGVGAWTAVRTAAISAGAATWGAIAPLLPLIAAVAAVALLAAAAMYALDKATHWKEDQELRENIAAGDATDGARLENVNKERAKKGKSALSFEQFKAWENDDSGEWKDPTAPQSNSQTPDIDAMTAKLAAIQSGAGIPIQPPAMAALPPSASAAPVAAPITAPELGAPVEAVKKRAAREAKNEVAALDPAGEIFKAVRGAITGVGENAAPDGKAGKENGKNARLELGARITGQNAKGNYILEIIAPKTIEIPNNGLGSVRGRVKR